MTRALRLWPFSRASQSHLLKGTKQRGFTLIEMSVVLVIIGLIVGGVLVGQDLVRAAGVRAQISQIEKYNQAANTFYGKYGYLPGDIPAAPAAQFGFIARPGYAGLGDGNGVIEGAASTGGNHCGYCDGIGETVLFWADLSTAGLIDGSFTVASAYTFPTSDITGTALSAYFPAAKIGGGNYVYVWSGGTNASLGYSNSINYFGLSAITKDMAQTDAGEMNSTPGLTVLQAYSIDNKMDDGFPQSGRVTATYLNAQLKQPGATWARGSGIGASDTSATAGSSTTCYDNGGVGGATQQYSVEISNGSNVNCALSVQFQ
jgi:prepilin-type N-terminal cleavage/methylation domain-containing protein